MFIFRNVEEKLPSTCRMANKYLLKQLVNKHVQVLRFIEEEAEFNM